jgi:hypothetical protein
MRSILCRDVNKSDEDFESGIAVLEISISPTLGSSVI